MRHRGRVARSNLREIQDVVDHRHQPVGGGLRHLQIFTLLSRQVGVQRQFGHTQHAIHGRTDLVAHVGQKLALGPVGGLRVLLGLL